VTGHGRCAGGEGAVGAGVAVAPSPFETTVCFQSASWASLAGDGTGLDSGGSTGGGRSADATTVAGSGSERAGVSVKVIAEDAPSVSRSALAAGDAGSDVVVGIDSLSMVSADKRADRHWASVAIPTSRASSVLFV
jgi:hypothetical protein